MSSTALVRTMDDVSRFSIAVAQSGMYKDMRTAAEAAVKLGIATELGLGLVGMSTVHVVEGKPTLGYQAMLALVKRSGRYNYRFAERTDERVEIAWFENGEEVGRSSCDSKDAERMGLLGKQNWRKFPRQMRTARAVSEGVNTYCPDVLGGAVYTPDEMGAEVDAEGNVVVGSVEVVAPQPAVVAEPETAGVGAAPAEGSEASAQAVETPTPPAATPAADASEPTTRFSPGSALKEDVSPKITKAQQKELAGAAKAAGLSWASLQLWMREQGIGDFDRQADMTVDAFHRCVAFCNETSWEPEIAADGLGEMADA